MSLPLSGVTVASPRSTGTRAAWPWTSRNRTAATVRIDSLLITRTTDGSEPYRPSTYRFSGVRDGEVVSTD